MFRKLVMLCFLSTLFFFAMPKQSEAFFFFDIFGGRARAEQRGFNNGLILGAILSQGGNGGGNGFNNGFRGNNSFRGNFIGNRGFRSGRR